jgi:hypothetical protein
MTFSKQSSIIKLKYKRRFEMIEILNEVRAEAEHELAVAQAKIAVVDSIKEKIIAKQNEVEIANYDETVSAEETEATATSDESF